MDMDMNMEAGGLGLPAWLEPAAWIYLAISVACAVVMAYQIFGRGRRTGSHAMSVAWIVGAMYLGPLALFMFQRAGQASEREVAGIDRRDAGHARATVRGGLLGGAASAIAHVIGVPFVVLTGLVIAGDALWAMVAVITVLAVVLLIAFEYAVRSSRSVAPGLAGTLAAALITIVFFDVGMLGWMLLLHFNGLMPAVTEVTFVFLMQVGLVLGFIAGAPAISVLLRRGAMTPA